MLLFSGPQLVLVDIDDPGRIIFQFPVMEDIQALQDNDARMKEVSSGFLSLDGHFMVNDCIMLTFSMRHCVVSLWYTRDVTCLLSCKFW